MNNALCGNVEQRLDANVPESKSCVANETSRLMEKAETLNKLATNLRTRLEAIIKPVPKPPVNDAKEANANHSEYAQHLNDLNGKIRNSIDILQDILEGLDI